MRNIVFTYEPALGHPDALNIAQYAEKLGYKMSMTSLDVACEQYALESIKKYGLTSFINKMDSLNEEVLPPSVPKSSLADLVRYMLAHCNPVAKMIIVDPYIFPDKYDADYIAFLESIFSRAFQKINRLEIATHKINTTIQSDFEAMAYSTNSNISISYKHTNYFHDRFVITDDSKGIYIGTSLNGIGKRFALVDYLQDSDVKEILSEYAAIP